MMMRMLEAGGIEPVVDHERKPNDDNPLGYYEFEPVKALKEDSSWVAESCGKTVKVIYKLVYDLPANVNYRIIFMQRDLEEVLASQETMMRRDGLDPDAIGRDILLQLFQTEVFEFRRWADAQPNIKMFYADYKRVVAQPEYVSKEIDNFLDEPMNFRAMAEVVDSNLYRNRAG